MRDTRTAGAVFSAVAAHVADQAAAATAVEALKALGVQWAWQLTHLSDGDWEKINVKLGLKSVVKAELAHPTPPAATQVDELAGERLRQFLLLPGPEGEVQPLDRIGALGFGLLVVPPVQRQQMALGMFELMALMSGLLLALPVALLQMSDPADDVFNAGVFFVIFVLVFIAFMCVAFYVIVILSGWQAGLRYYETIATFISNIFAIFFICALWPTLGLVGWAYVRISSSPYPLVAAAILGFVVTHVTNAAVFKSVVTEVMPLQYFHAPSWWLAVINTVGGPMGVTVTREACWPLAKSRAAELRSLASVSGADPDEGSF